MPTCFGLVPSQAASFGKYRLGHLTRRGPAVVRRLLKEAAWQAVRRSPTVRALFDRLRRDDPLRRKIALVAGPHHLARVMFALLRKDEPWREAAAAYRLASTPGAAPDTLRPRCGRSGAAPDRRTKAKQ